MFLATTAHQDYWDKDEKILFLGEWCKLYNQKHVWQNLQHDTLPYHWGNREKFHRDYLYCESLYEKYLKQLVGQLNQIHEVDHSSRYWRIIIGPWLFFFVGTIYDRYLSIKTAIDSKQVTNTWIPPFKSGQWVCANYLAFYDWSFCDEDYNLFVFGEIIRKLKRIPFETKSAQLQIEKPDKKNFPQSASFLKELAKKLLELYGEFIPGRFNDIVFANSHLSIVDLARLQLSLGQIPYPRVPQTPSSQSPSNFMVRNNLRSLLVDNEFESLLDDMLVELIPTSYVEDYASINQNCLKVFPKAPQVILSANFTFDEGLKFWIAFHVDKGVKFIMSQHGGGYGVHRWSFFESHELKVSDQYFSWGWEAKGFPNVTPIVSGKLSHAKGQIKPNPNGLIVWVTSGGVGRYARIHLSSILGPEIPSSYFVDQERFLGSVSPEVHDLLLLRLHPGWRDLGWEEYDRWEDIDPTLKQDQGSQSIFRQLNKSRLCIHTYNSTGYLESFAANFPTILFWGPEKREVRASAQPYFDDLRKVGILHDTPESAAAKVNEIYEDPLSWWLSDEIQEVINRFCHQFARTSDNWLLQWKEELLKITNNNKS